MPTTTTPRAPLWARVCAIAGCALMILSGSALIAGNVALARYAGTVRSASLLGEPGRVADIAGPLDILLVGIDPRDTTTAPLSDSIIVVHVTRAMDRAYLFSIPRDLVVDIPAYDKSGFKGARTKINAAMAAGSTTADGHHDLGQGFELLARTVSSLTGIPSFGAGAIVNFGGFREIVDAMGGVTMTVDQNVKSEHLRPDGRPRPRYTRCADNLCAHPYYGPQASYHVGRHHLEGWQALDYVRQRYGLPHSDYDRQRHQQQFIKAMAEQAMSHDVVTNPRRLDRVLQAAGSALVFDGKGHDIIDWALALHNVESSMTLVRLPGESVYAGNAYQGERLEPASTAFFDSVVRDRVGSFLIDHPDYLNPS